MHLLNVDAIFELTKLPTRGRRQPLENTGVQ